MKATKEEFAQMMVILRRAYPGSYFDEGEWGGTIQTFWHRFKEYRVIVLNNAFSAAIDKHPNKFPTLGQITALVDEHYDKDTHRRTMESRGKYLPAPARSRESAQATLYKMCGEVLTCPHQDLGSPEAHALLEGILVALGDTFGMSREEVIGDPDNPDKYKQFSLARSLIAIWRTRGYELGTVATGLRNVPSTCKDWPTERLMDDIIHGRDVAYTWPEEFVFSHERTG